MAKLPIKYANEQAIRQSIDVAGETRPAVRASEERVEILRYNDNFIFKPGEFINMDLLDANRTLVHVGKLFLQQVNGFNWRTGTDEVFVLLFDNYLVLTKPREEIGITKYHIIGQPLPLEFVTVDMTTSPPQQRVKGLFRRSIAEPDNARALNTFSICLTRRLGGRWTFFAESFQTAAEWKQKLGETISLRKAVLDAKKAFEPCTLISSTLTPPYEASCSVPLTTADGRSLIAIGCPNGIWFGFRNDLRSMRKVLDLTEVTHCAVLEEFGIFLVLADKSLYAYHTEALVPSIPPNANAIQSPQKLSGKKDVHFFTVGIQGGRTLVIYMTKRGLDSVFRVLEPCVDKVNDKSQSCKGVRHSIGLSQSSDWFRVYKDFFIPTACHGIIFLRVKIVILCSEGFEIMDLNDFKSLTIPRLQDDSHSKAVAKRTKECKPMGMFRSGENEFLLCYDEFGLYVDRHGNPSRPGTIEWEGKAEHVAWNPPYVLLFDRHFIEVRHEETGMLIQIIAGNDIRCIWDGRGYSTPSASMHGLAGSRDSSTQEARVHAVSKISQVSNTGSNTPGEFIQHVFELVPTLPLYVPDWVVPHSKSNFFLHDPPPDYPRRISVSTDDVVSLCSTPSDEGCDASDLKD